MLKETYLAKVRILKKKYPNAIFENITYTANSELAPSKELLIDAGIFKKADGTKNPKMSFTEYKQRYIEEIHENPLALQRLLYLIKLAKHHDVYLVCYEKNPTECHRSIVLEIASNFIDSICLDDRRNIKKQLNNIN